MYVREYNRDSAHLCLYPENVRRIAKGKIETGLWAVKDPSWSCHRDEQWVCWIKQTVKSSSVSKKFRRENLETKHEKVYMVFC